MRKLQFLIDPGEHLLAALMNAAASAYDNVSSGRDADDLLEILSQMTFIVETALCGDLGDRRAAQQHPLGVADAQGEKIFMWSGANLTAKGTHEVKLAETRNPREFFQRDVVDEVGV